MTLVLLLQIALLFGMAMTTPHEVKTNKRTNKQKNTSRKLFQSSHIDAKCMKRQGKFP